MNQYCYKNDKTNVLNNTLKPRIPSTFVVELRKKKSDVEIEKKIIYKCLLTLLRI